MSYEHMNFVQQRITGLFVAAVGVCVSEPTLVLHYMFLEGKQMALWSRGTHFMIDSIASRLGCGGRHRNDVNPIISWKTISFVGNRNR